MPRKSRTNLDALLMAGSAKKISRFMALWPTISQAMDKGISHKQIIEALKADGLDLTLNTFDSYSRRLRKESQKLGKETKQLEQKTEAIPVPSREQKDPKVEDSLKRVNGSSIPAELGGILDRPNRTKYYAELALRHEAKEAKRDGFL